ncbi:MAG: hypothetical protein Q8L39_00970 [Burkholderiales bacterium]|nr:hypothetical protein [Burkholderiales bacterium]
MQNRLVYAIYSHGNPEQVLRLVRTLRALSPQSHIVVHHDPSISPLKAQDVSSAGGIAIPDPVPGAWGDYALVKQHLHTMRWCLNNLEFEWYVTLTGQTYPIKPLQGFEEFLRDTPYDAYVTHFSAYDQNIWPNDEAVRRYHYRYIQLPRFRYWHKVPARLRTLVPSVVRLFNRSQPLLKLFPYPKSLPTKLGALQWRRPFGSRMPLIGSNLNSNYRQRVVQHIVEYADKHPEYARYFSKTALPDEVFFSTIVCNDQKVRVANDCLRHIFWPDSNAASVGVMDMTHWDNLEASDAYFALKIDQNTCPELLQQLDRKLGIHFLTPPD